MQEPLKQPKMKKIIIVCLLFLSIDGIAQDMDVVKYGYFSNPMFPIFGYQNLNVNKIPIKIEEVTYSYKSGDKTWEKVEEILYNFNADGFLNNMAKKNYYANYLSDFITRNYYYSKNGPTKVLLTRDNKKYLAPDNSLINKLEYLYNQGDLESIVMDKDTILAKDDPLLGKQHQIESEDFSGYYKLTYTYKIFGSTMEKHHYFSSTHNARALFHFQENRNTIDIYRPNDRTFYFNKFSTYLISDIKYLTDAVSGNDEAYEKLLLEPNYFNKNKVQGVGHLTFKDGINSNWIAIFNKKSSYYGAPTITMRKITFPDNSIEGTLDLDKSLSIKVND